MLSNPPVDAREPAEIAAQVRELFPRYVPGWPGPAKDFATEALINVFARYCGIIIDRLNKAPQKNLLAFVDMLGAEPLPLQAARTPLTFYLTANARDEVTIPALSQVTAPAPLGQHDPIFFETEQDFAAIPARLDALLVRDPAHDRFADYSVLLEGGTDVEGRPTPAADAQFLSRLAAMMTGDPPAPERLEAFVRDNAREKRARAVEEFRPVGAPLFSGDLPIEHSVYIAIGEIASEPLNRLTVHVEIAAPAARPLALAWSATGDSGETSLTLAADTTAGFTKTGDVIFEDVSPVVADTINGRKDRWLKCRLKDSLSGAMPKIARLSLTSEVVRSGLAIEKAYANASPIDLSKSFYPFGPSPGFEDTFYMASAAAFSAPGAIATLHVTLVNPVSSGNASPVPPVQPRATKLIWEFWDGAAWTSLGVSDFGRTTPWPLAGFADHTDALSETGDITFQFSAPPRSYVLNGQAGFWVRARIIFGDYGPRGEYRRDQEKGIVLVPPAPPLIQSVKCEYRAVATFEPRAIVAFNDFAYASLTSPYEPFQAAAGSGPYAYFGFSSSLELFPGRSLNLYLGLAKTPGLVAAREAAAAAPIVWEYWNGRKWVARSLRDDTAGLRRSGVLRFLTPSDFSAREEFGITRYWWRVHRPAQDKSEPRLQRAALNTVMASQTQMTFREVVGSSNGTEGQQFRMARKPVLHGQRLEVIEQRLPVPEELDRLLREEGASAVNKPELAATALNPQAVWIRWHEVPSFGGSDSQDRHYILDHETGVVTFGDGVRGKIPPAGTNNIRLYRYQTGGGSIGNLPPLVIAHLKTTIPYIERAVNLEPSMGGVDSENISSLIERAPSITRHGFRAVAETDFEDLAMSASPAVARAKCVPGFDLVADPQCTHRRGGVVSLIIVPASPVAAPVPDSELLDRVREYLDERRVSGIQLILTGPGYVSVDVTAEITVDDPAQASDAEAASRAALARFLHPLSGGTAGRGWNFGRLPAESDVYSLLEATPGVNHVRFLRLAKTEDTPGAIARGRFLIYGGKLSISSTLEA